MQQTWISGACEVKTTGTVEPGNVICFTVRRQRWERVAFKCEVYAEIIAKGTGVEINLIHRKMLPQFLIQAIRSMANEVIRENGMYLELRSRPTNERDQLCNKRGAGKFSLPAQKHEGRRLHVVKNA